LQELLLNAELTYQARRAFVWDAYTWDRGPPYALYGGTPGVDEDGDGKEEGKLIPARVPLSALIGGPIIGAPFPPYTHEGRHPRAISRAHFARVCPHPITVDPALVKARLDSAADAPTTIAHWVAELATLGPCVQIERDGPQLFDIWVLGNPDRLLPVWPAYRVSPIITAFRWSPLVRAALETNGARFPHLPDLPALPTNVPSPPNPDDALLPGLLALHIRRGDFADHCEHLAKWKAGFNAFNSFPALFEDAGRADERFVVPEGGDWGEATPENLAIYLRRCFPTFAQIAHRVRVVRTEWEARTGRRLGWVYVMTNGRREWLAELEGVLREEGDGDTFTWDGFTTSRDLALSREQRYVAQAVDMYIGTRAEVFIGNGFSSLTSNVVMLRMAHGVDPRDTRLW
ncbi:hypothetical protein DFH07DRAFT_730053, partial [Mycena maculata]